MDNETVQELKGVKVVSESGVTSFVPCDPGKTSDGYHTFDELYEHRCLLFLALIAAIANLYGHTPSETKTWKSLAHHDGTEIDGWFIAGVKMPTGYITYHLPDRLWNLCHAKYVDRAPEWDGHTSEDVLQRIGRWLGDYERD